MCLFSILPKDLYLLEGSSESLQQWLKQAKMEEEALQQAHHGTATDEEAEKDEQLDSFFLVAEEAQDLLSQKRREPLAPEEGIVEVGSGWAWGWNKKKASQQQHQEQQQEEDEKEN